MFSISKEFHFSAGHKLDGLREGHPCGNQHGHNYVVVVHLQSEDLNDVGFVQDYGELSEIKDFIDEHFDHKNLNDVLEVNPTAENIAFFLYKKFYRRFPKMIGVSVKETPKTIATYSV